MADETKVGSVEMQKTLGLTGLTMNAMALIAPGAFLWLTFYIQATTGTTGPAMWAGIVLALLLCLATAVCYAEMAKLYPGTGSSYYFAEQSFLNHDKVWTYARISKFIVGWGSHLYYWIYPGVMVGVMGIFCGYIVGTLWPNFMSASNPGPAFMMLCRRRVLLCDCLHRLSRRQRLHVGQHRHQRHPDLGTDCLLGDGARLSRQPSGRQPGRQFDSTSGQSYNYEFATTTQPPTDVSLTPSSAMPTRCRSRSWTPPASPCPLSSSTPPMTPPIRPSSRPIRTPSPWWLRIS